MNWSFVFRHFAALWLGHWDHEVRSGPCWCFPKGFSALESSYINQVLTGRYVKVNFSLRIEMEWIDLTLKPALRFCLSYEISLPWRGSCARAQLKFVFNRSICLLYCIKKVSPQRWYDLTNAEVGRKRCISCTHDRDI